MLLRMLYISTSRTLTSAIYPRYRYRDVDLYFELVQLQYTYIYVYVLEHLHSCTTYRDVDDYAREWAVQHMLVHVHPPFHNAHVAIAPLKPTRPPDTDVDGLSSNRSDSSKRPGVKCIYTKIPYPNIQCYWGRRQGRIVCR